MCAIQAEQTGLVSEEAYDIERDVICKIVEKKFGIEMSWLHTFSNSQVDLSVGEDRSSIGERLSLRITLSGFRIVKEKYFKMRDAAIDADNEGMDAL